MAVDQQKLEAFSSPRYIREWLLNQAASGIVAYDAATDRYTLPEEQALAFAVEDSPVFLPGAYQLMLGMVAGEEKVRPHFRHGGGIGYGDLHPGVHEGVDRFFRPGYLANLLPSWIPALEGYPARLERGAKMADIGCGQGTATRRAGGLKNLSFEEGTSTGFPGRDWDLVACFDSLHDMADPIGAARHIRSALKRDGTWLIVEPRAGDTVGDNLNPVGRVYSACSVLYCLTTSLSQKGAGLGAQAGEARIRDVVRQGGFSCFRRCAETPFNLVYEARP
jgi:SAM-dependent methyltransferase